MNEKPQQVKTLDVGLHYGIPAQAYHADPAPEPSLSSGVARTIISKSLAHAYAEHPRLGASSKKEETDAMDTGSLVHALLAGTVESEVEVRDYPTFRSKAAQEWAESVRAAGKIPALENDLIAARSIAEAVRTKAFVGLSNNPLVDGEREVTAIWEKRGTFFRARFDALEKKDGEPWTIWDWKVTGDVSVSEVKRKFRRFGYHLQAAHYLAAANALCPKFAGRHSFIFVFVENTAPFSVRRYCLKSDTLGVAALDIANAHTAWELAMRDNHWPDASRDETTFIDIPTFADDDDEPDTINTAA